MAAAPGVIPFLTDTSDSTILTFEDDTIPANFKPDIDIKFYTTATTPDPAVYMGLGMGLVGLFLRKRRSATAA